MSGRAEGPAPFPTATPLTPVPRYGSRSAIPSGPPAFPPPPPHPTRGSDPLQPLPNDSRGRGILRSLMWLPLPALLGWQSSLRPWSKVCFDFFLVKNGIVLFSNSTASIKMIVLLLFCVSPHHHLLRTFEVTPASVHRSVSLQHLMSLSSYGFVARDYIGFRGSWIFDRAPRSMTQGHVSNK